MALSSDEEIAKELTLKALAGGAQSAVSLVNNFDHDPKKLGEFVGTLYRIIFDHVSKTRG